MRTLKLKKCKRVHGLYFAPSGRLLAVGGPVVEAVGAAVWLDVGPGEAVERIELSGYRHAVPPDVSRLAVVGAIVDGRLTPMRWTPLGSETPDWRTVNGIENLVTEEGVMGGVAFDASGHVAIGNHLEFGGSRLTLLHLDTGTVVAERALAEFPGVLAFDAEGKRVAVSGGPEGGSAEVSVLGVPGLEPLFSCKPPGTRTRCLLFLPDGRLVAGSARNVYVLNGGEPQFVLGGHKGQVNAIALSPNGKQLLTASHDGAVRVWDTDGNERTTFDWKIGPVTAVTFSPDGLIAAAAGDRGQVVVWDVDG